MLSKRGRWWAFSIAVVLCLGAMVFGLTLLGTTVNDVLEERSPALTAPQTAPGPTQRVLAELETKGPHRHAHAAPKGPASIDADPVGTALREARARFKTMPVVYKRPSVLPYQRPTTFRLVIASSDLASARQRAANGEAGAPVEHIVDIGNRVKAELDGNRNQVDIQAYGPPVRDVSNVANVTWEWSVTPKTPGPLQLTLAIYNEAAVNGVDQEIDGPAYEDTFQVSVTNGQKLALMAQAAGQYWAWIGGIVLAIAGFVAWLLRQRSTSKARPKPRPPAARLT